MVRYGIAPGTVACDEGEAMSTIGRTEPGATGTPPAPTSPPAPADGEDRLQLTPEWREYYADVDWVHEEYNAGRWAQYAGEYIAVVGKKLLGHGPDRLKLRQEVARESGVRPGRIHITYIEPPIEC
jgi:hypothetical protein